MKRSVGLFLLSVMMITVFWAWRGMPVAMPPDPLGPGEKLYCVSYAPFRGWQTPLDPTTVIPPAQIEEDLAALSRITDCVRTYSVDLGLDKVPEIAQRHGLKVLLGIWVSSESKRNEEQIRTGVALANRFREAVRGVVVGNEVLLRGETTRADLERMIRSVREQVRVPVTYADVWEYWIRNRELAGAVDFVTVHILPYWEDIPIAAEQAGSHIASIRAHVGEAFPGKEILIGEAGWPSAGRMREGALPSPSAQARALHDLVSLARSRGFLVNLIEAFDQPWKRHLEGTVGGHWGLVTDWGRSVKFAWGQPVSDHPYWGWQALGGGLLAALVFGVAMLQRRRRGGADLDQREWLSVAVMAGVAGALIGAVVEAVVYESLGFIGWARSLGLLTAAIAMPLAGAAAIAGRIAPVSFAEIIGPRARRSADPVALVLGAATILTAILAMESALGLTFNPRYLDFPFAALTAAGVPLAVVMAIRRPEGQQWPAAETVFAVVFAVAAVKIVIMETPANWQAVWLSLALIGLAAALARARVAPG